MNTKLTLIVDKEVIVQAKAFAQSQGRSLSNLVENYLKSVIDQKKPGEISPTVKSLAGSFNVPDDFDYKTELSNALADKYLKQ
jgi:hypothetical protein